MEENSNSVKVETRRFSLRWWSHWIPAVIFLVAVLALLEFFKHHSLQQVYLEITSLPLTRVLMAFGVVILAYAFLSVYDVLALTYLNRKYPFLQTGRTAFSAFALNNSLGMGGVFGNALRFKKYLSLGMEKTEIINLVAVIAISFWVAFLLVGGTSLTLKTFDLDWRVKISHEIFRALGILFLGLFFGYVALCFKKSRKIVLFKHEFPFPPVKLALKLIMVGVSDWVLMALVLFTLLPTTSPVDFLNFVAIFCVAQTLALITHVPGGIGVFEALVIYFISPDHQSTPAIIAALFVYRILYYFIPFIIAIVMVFFSAIRAHRKASI